MVDLNVCHSSLQAFGLCFEHLKKNPTADKWHPSNPRAFGQLQVTTAWLWESLRDEPSVTWRSLGSFELPFQGDRSVCWILGCWLDLFGFLGCWDLGMLDKQDPLSSFNPSDLDWRLNISGGWWDWFPNGDCGQCGWPGDFLHCWVVEAKWDWPPVFVNTESFLGEAFPFAALFSTCQDEDATACGVSSWWVVLFTCDSICELAQRLAISKPTRLDRWGRYWWRVLNACGRGSGANPCEFASGGCQQIFGAEIKLQGASVAGKGRCVWPGAASQTNQSKCLRSWHFADRSAFGRNWWSLSHARSFWGCSV